jgi:hypothetical protein
LSSAALPRPLPATIIIPVPKIIGRTKRRIDSVICQPGTTNNQHPQRINRPTGPQTPAQELITSKSGSWADAIQAKSYF